MRYYVQYLRHSSGVDSGVDPPTCSPLGHHLINTKGIGHCRKQCSCVDHVLPATAPRFEIIDAARWPLGSHRPQQGLRDLDHAHGQLRPLINRRLLDAQEVCEPPLVLRVSNMERQVDAQPSIVDQGRRAQRHITTA